MKLNASIVSETDIVIDIFQKMVMPLVLCVASNEKVSVAKKLTENKLLPNKEKKRHWRLRPKLQINESVIQVQVLVNGSGPMYMKVSVASGVHCRQFEI